MKVIDSINFSNLIQIGLNLKIILFTLGMTHNMGISWLNFWKEWNPDNLMQKKQF